MPNRWAALRSFTWREQKKKERSRFMDDNEMKWKVGWRITSGFFGAKSSPSVGKFLERKRANDSLLTMANMSAAGGWTRDRKKLWYITIFFCVLWWIGFSILTGTLSPKNFGPKRVANDESSSGIINDVVNMFRPQWLANQSYLLFLSSLRIKSTTTSTIEPTSYLQLVAVTNYPNGTDSKTCSSSSSMSL